MRKTSKKHFPEKITREIWKPFQKEIKNARTGKDILKALSMILTEDEKIICEKRMVIKLLLANKVRSGQIRNIVDVNKATVRFVRGGFKRNVPMVKKEPEKKERPDLLEDWFGGGDGLFRKHRFIR